MISALTKVTDMGDNKITPWEDYSYSPKLPDFWEVTGVGVGMASCKAYQASLKRPLTRRSSVTLMTAYMVGGYLIGKAGVLMRDNSSRRRQVFIDDYMAKHPEDFLTSEPKKFKDVLWEWTPYR